MPNMAKESAAYRVLDFASMSMAALCTPHPSHAYPTQAVEFSRASASHGALPAALPAAEISDGLPAGEPPSAGPPPTPSHRRRARPAIIFLTLTCAISGSSRSHEKGVMDGLPGLNHTNLLSVDFSMSTCHPSARPMNLFEPLPYSATSLSGPCHTPPTVQRP